MKITQDLEEVNEEKDYIHCEYCNRVLKREEKVIFMGKVEYKIKLDFERCICNQSILYWKKLDFEKIQRQELENLKQKESRINKLFENSNITKRLRKYTFENFTSNNNNSKAYTKCLEYCNDYINNKKRDKSIYITGFCGTGKTHLACSIGQELIKSEISVVFGTLTSLLMPIRDSYMVENKTESQYIKIYSSVGLLIIDDLGKEKPTEWVLDKLFVIINNRYQNELPVIITTNYNRNLLRERLASNGNYEIVDSIISRLYEMSIGINIVDKDHRKY